MRKSIVWLFIFGVVVLAGCFHKPKDNVPAVNTGNIIETGGTVDNDAFDPNNFNDPEVKEVFDLLEELVAEDEDSDDQAADVESGADADVQ